MNSPIPAAHEGLVPERLVSNERMNAGVVYGAKGVGKASVAAAKAVNNLKNRQVDKHRGRQAVKSIAKSLEKRTGAKNTNTKMEAMRQRINQKMQARQSRTRRHGR